MELSMGCQAKRRLRHRPVLESLEGRVVLATFGVPWHDASNLTLSFVPDGTKIAGHTSNLFQTLNAQEPTAVWEQQILRAFQTWAVEANINIAVVPDSGAPLGVAGQSQHDPRFGDIRIGAQPMSPEALSISVPNDPSLSSTLSGDVLINSNELFGGTNLNLTSVILHEAGHVFGIGDGTDPNSAMYSQYTGNTTLTPGDISALQSLYGVRAPDSHEGSSGNNSMNTATQIQPSGSSSPATPLVAFGDVSSNSDLDFYSLRMPSNYQGPVTFRLQSAGLSLLAPHLTILDSNGKVLGDAQADSMSGDIVTIHLNQAVPNATYYLEVQGATQDVFGIGSYGVAATFDAANTVSPDTLDTVLRGPYQALSANDITSLLQNPGQTLINNGHRDNEGVAMTQLTSTPGYAFNSHFETVGSLSASTAVNLYRVQTPSMQSGQNLVLTVTVRALDVNGMLPRVSILDGNMIPVSSQILANGDGTFSIQAAGLKPHGNYYLQVTSNGSTTNSVGNFALDAELGTAVANLSTFASGTLASTIDVQSYDFYVGESQLMQFVLSASAMGAPAGAAVQMTIVDSSGNVIDSLNATAGDTVSAGALFVTPGAYTIRFSMVGVTDPNAPPISYILNGEEISDPIGPVLQDPTLKPVYGSPTMPGIFTYPNGTTTTSSFLIVPKPK
jgi:hypothetical protein